MKVTKEQKDEITKKVIGAGFPPEAIIDGERKIVFIGDSITSAGGELEEIVNSVLRPVKEEPKEEEVPDEPEPEVEPEDKPKKKAKKSRSGRN